MFILFKGNFIPIKFVISAFLVNFVIRVFVSPRLAPTLIASRLIVRNQVPEYVSAAPKKLAWISEFHHERGHTCALLEVVDRTGLDSAGGAHRITTRDTPFGPVDDPGGDRTRGIGAIQSYDVGPRGKTD